MNYYITKVTTLRPNDESVLLKRVIRVPSLAQLISAHSAPVTQNSGVWHAVSLVTCWRDGSWHALFIGHLLAGRFIQLVCRPDQ